MTDFKSKIFNVFKRKLKVKEKFLIDLPDKKITDADFSSNIAFILGKRTRRKPEEVALEIIEKLKENSLFSFLENKKGFINIWLSDSSLKKEIENILKDKTKNTFRSKSKERIQIEYISANPTGPLTLANGRGGFFGDVLSNILKLTHLEVEREYYVNDTGNQILTLGKSLMAHLNIIPLEKEFYCGDYIKEWAKNNKEYIVKNKNNPLKIGQKAAKYFLKNIKNVLEKKAGIKFDRYTSEASLHKKGFVEEALKILKKSGLVFEKDGALWLKTTEFGDDKDRVLLTREGNPTYFLADAGHYLETLKRGFKNKINILGPDHYGYVKRIQSVAQILGFKKSEVLITQAILLKENGEFIRMSKRKGQFVTFEELIDEVGKDVARFMFLNQALNSHIDFDLRIAKEKSQKNPLFYVEYAYVRAKNILRKSHLKEYSLGDLKEFSTLQRNLVFKLVNFPTVLNEVKETYEVHKFLKYVTSLAGAFHNFYERERVLGSNDEPQKLALVKSFVVVMDKIFGLLNITLPQKM